MHLHDFEYPEGPFRGFPLEIRLQGRSIASLRDRASGRELATARLEPVEFASLFDEHMEARNPVRLEAVPEPLVQAVLAVEDRRFLQHHGLDPLGTARAALANVRAREVVQGGSTLTQQLVKNYYLTHERTLSRKVREAVMAVLLELRHSKDAILEAYLNEVYLGQRGAASVMGVGEAARHYFSKEVGQLELAEAALLAGLIRSPGRYDPFRRPESARARRATVLELMRAQGRISAENARAAARAPLPERSVFAGLDQAPYFTDFVVRELRDRFSRHALEREGFRIFTTLDPRAQVAAERAVQEGLAALEAAYPRLAADSSVRVQAALVALDPATGELLALVGGRDFATSPFNRAVQARRQPGSLFKPWVYLTALSDPGSGWTLATPLSDSALIVRSGGRAWSPRNHDGRIHGVVSLREALERSYNIATSRLALEVGLEPVIETARRAGIRSPMSAVPSLALGAFEVSPIEMAEAYSTLASGGVRPRPVSILEVVAPDGESLEARGLEMERQAPAAPVYLVNRALQGVLSRGTASAARRLGYRGPAAGKTGTTSATRDAWFVGYTPELVALVWVGFDDNRSTGLTGALAALPLWVRFVQALPDARPYRDFVAPEGVVEVRVDSATGKLAEEDECGPARVEVFLVGTEPEESCDDGWWIF